MSWFGVHGAIVCGCPTDRDREDAPLLVHHTQKNFSEFKMASTQMSGIPKRCSVCLVLISSVFASVQEVTLELVRESMQKQKQAKGILLEGYPRTVPQVQEYEKYVSIHRGPAQAEIERFSSSVRSPPAFRTKDQESNQNIVHCQMKSFWKFGLFACAINW